VDPEHEDSQPRTVMDRDEVLKLLRLLEMKKSQSDCPNEDKRPKMDGGRGGEGCTKQESSASGKRRPTLHSSNEMIEAIEKVIEAKEEKRGHKKRLHAEETDASASSNTDPLVVDKVEKVLENSNNSASQQDNGSDKVEYDKENEARTEIKEFITDQTAAACDKAALAAEQTEHSESQTVTIKAKEYPDDACHADVADIDDAAVENVVEITTPVVDNTMFSHAQTESPIENTTVPVGNSASANENNLNTPDNRTPPIENTASADEKNSITLENKASAKDKCTAEPDGNCTTNGDTKDNDIEPDCVDIDSDTILTEDLGCKGAAPFTFSDFIQPGGSSRQDSPNLSIASEKSEDDTRHEENDDGKHDASPIRSNSMLENQPHLDEEKDAAAIENDKNIQVNNNTNNIL
jgi:hypothetical protein